MLIHLKEMLAGRSLPSQKAWISVDWKRFLLLALCASQLSLGMEQDDIRDTRTDLDKQLWNACLQDQDLAQMDRFLEQGANPNSKNSYGSNLLTECAQSCWVQRYVFECERLIKAGADVNAYADNGIFPLFAAANYGRVDVCQLLLNEGANPNQRTKENPFNQRSDFNPSALFQAAFRGNFKICKMLLVAGADPNICDNQGRTPLMMRSFLPIFELLLQFGADTRMKDKTGKTAIDVLRDQARQNQRIDDIILSKNIALLEDPEKIHAVIMRADNPNPQMKKLRKKEKNIFNALMNRELGLPFEARRAK